MVGTYLQRLGSNHTRRESLQIIMQHLELTARVSDSKQIGWGIEGLEIDPFDSNHFLYGTGLTLYGSRSSDYMLFDP